MKSHLNLGVTVLAVAACRDVPVPTAPEPPTALYEEIVKVNVVLSSGNEHFFFLPPLAPAPAPTGVFDPTVDPVVKVCELVNSACAAVIAEFTMAIGPGSETVRVVPEDEHYIVSWHLKRTGAIPERTYRIRVLAEGHELGSTDIVPRIGTKTIPVKFRIEEGAIVRGDIVFVSNRDGPENIYVMKLDGTGVRRLTNTSMTESGPQWSPDGRRVAITSERDGQREIYVMNADGTGQTRLTNSPGTDDCLGWSPDGSRIVFSSWRDGNGEIYVMNADGSNPVRITESPDTDNEPTWSPDGNRIAFISYRHGVSELYLIDLITMVETRLTNDSAYDYSPDWSPDGARIVFRSERDAGGGHPGQELYLLDLDGMGITRITTNSVLDTEPAWLPDGRILFASARDSGSFRSLEIYVMKPDGTGVTRITTNGWNDSQPDGRL